MQEFLLNKFTRFFLVLSFILLLFFTRGAKGSPLYFQKEKDTKISGPFEVSISSSRYALTESIVKNHSLFLDKKLAQFSSPDIGDKNGKFFSLFPPGVSFIGVPFYFIGKFIGLPQLTTFFSIAFFAFINMLLVSILARRLGCNIYSALMSGFIFLFATNALVYSEIFVQHHASTTLLLLLILNCLKTRSWKNNLALGLLYGFSALVDIPNLVIFFPLVVHMLIKSKKTNVSLGALVGGIVFLLLIFGFYNRALTDSFVKLPQSIGRSHFFRNTTGGQNPAEYKNNPIKNGLSIANIAFDINNPLYGLYILLLSNERSWLFYSPVILLGFIGLFKARQRKKLRTVVNLLFMIIIFNILLYSLYDDPWGGWAFGPRYLIPSAALLSLGVGFAIERYKKSFFSVLLFLSLFLYSIAVNILAAVTTSTIPPKIEAVRFDSPLSYTYTFNFPLLEFNISSNLFYNIFLSSRVKLLYYLLVLIFITFIVGLALLKKALLKENKLMK